MMQIFHPIARTLMGPGPSQIHPRVLAAAAKPIIGHLDPLFIGMMNEIKSMLQGVMQTSNPLTMAVSAPGSAGMECCFVNLVEPGDKVIVCINGVFGGRMRENVIRQGGHCIVVEDEWGKPVDPHKVEEALKAHPDAKILAFVHAETSTGVRSDAQTLCRLARQHGCLTIVDAVTSLAGVPLMVDDWGIDAVYSGSQKCLSCVPGLAPVSFSEPARKVIQARTHPVTSWFLDLQLVMDYWGNAGKNAPRSYHHTAPVNSLYSLHEALVMVHKEGLQQVWERHQSSHLLLKQGLEAIGIEFVVDQEHRLPQLNTVRIPAGIDDAGVRSALLDEYNLEIGAGLGSLAGKVWRIGLMGHTAHKENVLLCVSALREVLSRKQLRQP